MFALLLLSGFIYLLYRLFRPTGNAGEWKVSNEITSLVTKNSEYHFFDNIILKTPDGTTEIDQIIISPYGIFVIETKNFKGWIFGNAYQKEWTQSLFTRTFGFFRYYSSIKYKFQNPLHQNYKHVKAVEKFLGVDRKFIFSIIVFTGDSEFKTDMPDNVVELDGFSLHLKSYTEKILSQERVERLSQRLRDHVEHAPYNERDHIRNVEQNRRSPICPRCGKVMVLRIARKGPGTGSQFWGCQNFPSCKVVKRML